ncbi:hypothetical protein J108_11460 [Mycobacteroides abscessus subsp. bolletii CRM-0020]|uniref:Uncharacterized protein n=1 Tax=Mycobacteroides abscessus subsp. bolletii CRM-0020 TaxID=1306401 RepID=A0A829HUL1_9MYCO|nr:hypothetical protein J108_11460 [Mycobacteroides abscessus subsp. bolletii CRM-0020]
MANEAVQAASVTDGETRKRFTIVTLTAAV